MPAPTKIQHPLLRRPGTSQRRRIAAALALQPDYARIDGRSLGDILDYIHRYARQVVFHEQKTDEAGNVYVELGDWLPFFEKSLPFRLTQFAKTDFDRLENNLLQIVAAIEQKSDPDSLALLINFCFSELVSPVENIQELADEHDFDLRLYLNSSIRASFVSPLRRYILLSNTARKYFCIGKQRCPGVSNEPWSRFNDFTEEPWSIEDTFATDESITHVPGGREGALLWITEELAQASFQMLRALRPVALELPNYLVASLDVLQGRHEPHLGLLFAFIRLFSHFQNDLNQLTRKHLDFFYRQVLQIKPKALVPDKAHLIFEIAQHLKTYRVPQYTPIADRPPLGVFKDGKDKKNADIRFGLDDEVLIDKAQVKGLKTLYLNTVQDCTPRFLVEGVYVAPVANSSDGKGEPFLEDQSKNWAALGAKTGKYAAPGKDKPENYPFGRIGFVLVSPVLWLNEGMRDVTIAITCDAGGNADIFTECFSDNWRKALSKVFYKISEEAIIRIENLFSSEARTFLQERLDAESPLQIPAVELEAFLAPVENGGQFTEPETEILRDLMEEVDSGNDAVYLLHELPFASLIRYFNLLRLHQDPYCIGFDVDAFLQTKDPVTCAPLLEAKLWKWIIPELDHGLQSSNLFNLHFSGEKGWFQAKGTLPPGRVSLEIVTNSGAKTVSLTFKARLKSGEPKVVFYDPQAIGETFKTAWPFPMVKIELNPEIQFACENKCEGDQCCLGNRNGSDKVITALYQFFRYLKVSSVRIDVEVEGVKNLIVQNQESLQDVNSLVLPFGSRPKLGAHFFVGNKEIFCKNWTKFALNVKWKDKPVDLTTHYKDYDPKLNLEVEPPATNVTKITDDIFKIDYSILQDGAWCADALPFPHPPADHRQDLFRAATDPHNDRSSYPFDRLLNPCIPYQPTKFDSTPLGPLTVNSRDAFFRLTLRGASFQHAIYPFALADFLLQLADKVSLLSVKELDKGLVDAINLSGDIRGLVAQIESGVGTLRGSLLSIKAAITADSTIFEATVDGVLLNLATADTALAVLPVPDVTTAVNEIQIAGVTLAGLKIAISGFSLNRGSEVDAMVGLTDSILTAITGIAGVKAKLGDLDNKLNGLRALLAIKGALPKEPYTPSMESIFIDYSASAVVDSKVPVPNDDIELIHLYPFSNSSKTEHLPLKPTLLPTFADEGTLFIGLDKIRPGANLQLLFQFAEATADSESSRADINWHYLTGNRWQPLRTGFELVSDQTDQMTRSGIVRVAVPRDMSNVGNTLMPPTEKGEHLYWLKVSAPKSVAAVAELVGVHAQAALATYQPLPGSDSNRVGKALEPMSISKPLQPDFSIKKVEQPYESFGGQVAEAGGHVYTRVSEHLRHKGRSVDIFDFEHLVLEAFPDLFKCKCISHTMGLSANDYRRDLEVAPGFITVAVVPDLSKLKAGDMLEPRAPVSMLADVKAYLQGRLSPFARLRVMNPRYERIRVKVKVRLMRGRDESYYTAQLKTDLMHFLAPWYLGDSDKISFGQALVYSDVVGFIENLEYIDFIADLKLFDSEGTNRKEIVPLTARSILAGGEVCIEVDRENCQEPPPTRPDRVDPISMLHKAASFPCGTGRPFLKGGERTPELVDAPSTRSN